MSDGNTSFDAALEHSTPGNALQGPGRSSEAVASYRRALECEPDRYEIHYNLGNTLHDLGASPEAEASYRRALELRPEFPLAYLNLGNVLRSLGRPGEAEAAYRRALQLEPDFREAHNNLGVVLQALGRSVEAEATFCRAIELSPESCEAHYNLGLLRSEAGSTAAAIVCVERALALTPDAPALGSALICIQETDSGSSPAERISRRRAWAERFADRLTRAADAARTNPDPARRLRIGYVGANTFCRHTGAMVLLPLIEAHDESAFEIYCYSDTRPEHVDEITARFKRASIFREAHSLDDGDLAALIRSDGIDVLVENYGHPPGSRLLAVARRPAPVQVGFQTMGPNRMEAFDYTIGHRVLIPRSMQSEYLERVIRLPSPYLYSSLCALPAADPRSPFERAGRITFGSLNRLSKISDPVLDAWARILHAVPSAQLVIEPGVGGDRHLARFRERIRSSGLPAERVTLLGASGGQSRYLACYNEIDIVLDTFPYCGITTTCDALLTGVPVIALAADRVLGRYAAAILVTLSLEELVASSISEYVVKAVALAESHEHRSALRRELPGRVKRSRLVDGDRMARDMERVYRAVWRRWCAQKAPRTGIA